MANLATRLRMTVRRESPHLASLTNGDNFLLVYGPPNAGVSLNGRRVADGHVLAWRDRLYVTDDLATRLGSLVRPPRSTSVSRRAPPQPVTSRIGIVRGTVVLDAGHGGKDPGAPNRYGPSEKHITLDTTLRLRDYLASHGVKVILTRSGDTYPTLDQRVALANRVRPDLFVSIHADSAPNRSAQGYTVYAARGASARSLDAAQQLNQSLRGSGVRSRGIDRANFRVLAKTTSPALLVELGFLSNAAEAQLLATPQYRQHLAEVIGDGILAALRARQRA